VIQVPRLLRWLAAFGALSASFAATAQDFPNRSLRLLVPYAAGGGVDITARLLAEELRATLGQTVIVENVPGGATMIATRAAVKAPADGHTLLFGDSSMAVNPLINKKMDYNWETDLAPISLIVKVPNVLTVHHALPVHSVDDLLSYAKAQKLAYGSSGVGNANHLGGELFNKMAGTSITHVPYRGVALQLADVAAGHVAMTMASIGASQSFIKSGRVRPIAVTSLARSSSLPNVPALSEHKAFPGFDVSNYFALFAPAGTPPAVLKRLNGAVHGWLAKPEVATKLKEMGFEPSPTSTDGLQRFVRTEAERYVRIAREANVKLEE
jgi:tripartite-type tricarboxylate transporter receptor subunit TctC